MAPEKSALQAEHEVMKVYVSVFVCFRHKLSIKAVHVAGGKENIPQRLRLPFWLTAKLRSTSRPDRKEV